MRIITLLLIFVLLVFGVLQAQIPTDTINISVKEDRNIDLTFIGTNKHGFKEHRNEKDSSVLVEVTAGRFIMGENDGNNSILVDDEPIQDIHLARYYIGKYEVTISQYRKFVNATGYKTDAEKAGDMKWFHEYASWRNAWSSQTDNHPVVYISWNDAKAYCNWAGMRLPTEAEWEKAVRGVDGRRYPWGNRCDSSKANCIERELNATSFVGYFTQDISPYGCYDMAGNVMEWCNDFYGYDYYRSSPDSNPPGPVTGTYKIVRGGMFDGSLELSFHRYYMMPDERQYDLGFRIAK